MKYGYFSSPSSSPPTPPSPLPISFGPGNVKYCFSASPSLSPPFSPASSSQESASSPLLLYRDEVVSRPNTMSSLWLDGLATDEVEKQGSCLHKISIREFNTCQGSNWSLAEHNLLKPKLENPDRMTDGWLSLRVDDAAEQTISCLLVFGYVSLPSLVTTEPMEVLFYLSNGIWTGCFSNAAATVNLPFTATEAFI